MSSSAYSGSNIKERLQSICNPAPAGPQPSFTHQTTQPNLGFQQVPQNTSPLVYALVGLVVGAIVVLIAVKFYWYMKSGGNEVESPQSPAPPPVNANDFFNGIARSLIQQKQQTGAGPSPPVSPVTPAIAPVAAPSNPPPAPIAPTAPTPAPVAPAAPQVNDSLENDPNFTPI